MKSILTITALFMTFLIISCQNIKPEDIDVNDIKTNCDYVVSLSKVVDEIKVLEIEKKTELPEETISTINMRLGLLSNKLLEILNFAIKNNVTLENLKQCEGFYKMQFGNLKILLFNEGMNKIAKNEIEESYLFVDLALGDNPMSRDISVDNLMVKYLSTLKTLDKDSLTLILNNTTQNIENYFSKRKNNSISPYWYIHHYGKTLAESAKRTQEIINGSFLSYYNYKFLLSNGYVTTDSEQLFGIASFDYFVLEKLRNISDNDIKSLTASDIYKCIQNNDFFGLRLSAIPQVNNTYSKLKKINQYDIVNERDNFINEMLDLKKIYLKAYFKYRQTKFKIQGICFVSEDDYNINNQALKMTLFIENKYLCDVYTAFSLEEAKSFFSSKKSLKGVVEFIVSPGHGHRTFSNHAHDRNSPSITEMILLEEAIITFNIPSNTISFSTVNFKGKPLWQGIGYWVWDNNYQYQYPQDRLRISVQGEKL